MRTASGANAVQIMHGSRRGSRDIEHIGSAHDPAAVEALKAVARQRLAGGQGELDLDTAGVESAALAAAGSGPLPIASTRMSALWDALCSAYNQLGFDTAATTPAVMAGRMRCSGRWCWRGSSSRPARPTACGSLLRSAWAPSPRTPRSNAACRALQGYADDAWRRRLAAACAAHARLAPASLVLYDVSTL